MVTRRQFSPEERLSRRNRIRKERAAAWDAHEAAVVVAYSEKIGKARDLRPHDVLMSCGGITSERHYKESEFGKFGATVIEAGVTAGQRTRMHLVLAERGLFILNQEYPVRYRRPL